MDHFQQTYDEALLRHFRQRRSYRSQSNVLNYRRCVCIPVQLPSIMPQLVVSSSMTSHLIYESKSKQFNNAMAMGFW